MLEQPGLLPCRHRPRCRHHPACLVVAVERVGRRALGADDGVGLRLVGRVDGGLALGAVVGLWAGQVTYEAGVVGRAFAKHRGVARIAHVAVAGGPSDAGRAVCGDAGLALQGGQQGVGTRECLLKRCACSSPLARQGLRASQQGGLAADSTCHSAESRCCACLLVGIQGVGRIALGAIARVRADRRVGSGLAHGAVGGGVHPRDAGVVFDAHASHSGVARATNRAAADGSSHARRAVRGLASGQFALQGQGWAEGSIS